MRDGRAELVQLLQLTRRLSLHVVSVLDFWRKNCEVGAATPRTPLRRDVFSDKISPHRLETPPFIRLALGAVQKERGVCLWQGSSYLSKMCSDTDFLAEVRHHGQR